VPEAWQDAELRERARGHERERHHVTPNDPLFVLADVAAPNRDVRHPGRGPPRDAQGAEADPERGALPRVRRQVERGDATNEHRDNIESARPSMNGHRTPPQAWPELEEAGDEGESASCDVSQQPGAARPVAAEFARRDVGEERDSVRDQKSRDENNETRRDNVTGRAPDDGAVGARFESSSTAWTHGTPTLVQRRASSRR